MGFVLKFEHITYVLSKIYYVYLIYCICRQYYGIYLDYKGYTNVTNNKTDTFKSNDNPTELIHLMTDEILQLKAKIVTLEHKISSSIDTTNNKIISHSDDESEDESTDSADGSDDSDDSDADDEADDEVDDEADDSVADSDDEADDEVDDVETVEHSKDDVVETVEHSKDDVVETVEHSKDDDVETVEHSKDDVVETVEPDEVQIKLKKTKRKYTKQ